MLMKLSQVLCVLKKDSKTPIDLGPFILAVGLTSIGKGLVIANKIREFPTIPRFYEWHCIEPRNWGWLKTEHDQISGSLVHFTQHF